MDFSAYDNKELERYADEAKKRWGKTNAYKEYTERTKGRSMEQQAADGNDLMDIFRQLGQIRHLAPESPEAQALVVKLQQFITDHYYTCTPQILRSLGQMYIAGDEMTENIDRAGGEGTAAFAHKAIEHYCK